MFSFGLSNAGKADKFKAMSSETSDRERSVKNLLFIVNPKAGVRLQRRIRESIENNLDPQTYSYGIWMTEYKGHAPELAQKAIQEGFDVVVAVGGDGSINEVASGLLHSSGTLGIIPAGSGNGLAMHLGYGRNIDKAIQKLNSAQMQVIDAGRFNGRPFFNVAGIGFDGLVSNLMEGKNKRGFIPYFTESVKAGLHYESKDCVLEFEGKRIERKCFAIAIANGPMYGYNFEIAPGAKLDDGLFSIVLLNDAPRWQYFAAVPATLNGKILEAPFVEHFTAKSLKIWAEGSNFVHLDGEGMQEDGEMHIEVLPQALRVLVPST